MRNTKQLNLLKSLVEIPSPSGCEQEIANFIKKELSKMNPNLNISVDHSYNVICTIKGTSNRTIVLDAHLDTIGFCITNIGDDGIITIGQVGSADQDVIASRPLEILTEKGKINAVIDRTPPHLVTDPDQERIIEDYEAQVDIGIRKKSQVSKYVKIGDFVAYKPYFDHLIDNFYTGSGFDDKAGCYVLLETVKTVLKDLGTKKPPVNLVFVFSSQEETDSRLKSVVNRVAPDAVISVDVTFATDYGIGSILDAKAGKCHVGKGMVIYRGLGINNPCANLMEKIAKKQKIKYQIQANTTPGGFTSLMLSDKGVKSMILGIPLRNMHTPVEILNLNDLDNGAKLLSYYLLSDQLRSALDK